MLQAVGRGQGHVSCHEDGRAEKRPLRAAPSPTAMKKAAEGFTHRHNISKKGRTLAGGVRRPRPLREAMHVSLSSLPCCLLSQRRLGAWGVLRAFSASTHACLCTKMGQIVFPPGRNGEIGFFGHSPPVPCPQDWKSGKYWPNGGGTDALPGKITAFRAPRAPNRDRFRFAGEFVSPVGGLRPRSFPPRDSYPLAFTSRQRSLALATSLVWLKGVTSRSRDAVGRAGVGTMSGPAKKKNAQQAPNVFNASCMDTVASEGRQVSPALLTNQEPQCDAAFCRTPQPEVVYPVRCAGC